MSQCEKCGQDVPTGTPTLKEKIERLNPKTDISWIEFVEKLKEILLELEAKNGITFIPHGIFPSFPTPCVPPTIPYQPQIAVNPWNDPSYYPGYYPRITCVNTENKMTPVPDGTGYSGDPS